MAGFRSPVLAIFDHDGVLVDSLPFHEESWFEMGRRERLSIPSDFIRETFGMTNPAILRRLLGDGLDPLCIERYSRLKEECYRDVARGHIELMTGVRELLDGLTEAGVLLAIGSSGPRLNLDLTVSSCGLDGRFVTIVSVDDIKHGKPDPEVFLKAAKQAGVDPSRAAVFEDATVGIQAAKAAGMWGIGVGGTRDLDVLRDAGADEVVPDLAGYPVDRLVCRLSEGI